MRHWAMSSVVTLEITPYHPVMGPWCHIRADNGWRTVRLSCDWRNHPYPAPIQRTIVTMPETAMNEAKKYLQAIFLYRTCPGERIMPKNCELCDTPFTNREAKVIENVTVEMKKSCLHCGGYAVVVKDGVVNERIFGLLVTRGWQHEPSEWAELKGKRDLALADARAVAKSADYQAEWRGLVVAAMEGFPDPLLDRLEENNYTTIREAFRDVNFNRLASEVQREAVDVQEGEAKP